MYDDYFWLNTVSLITLSRGYIGDNIPLENAKEKAVERIEEIISTAEGLLGFSLPTLRHGAKRGWISFSSPVWSNFGKRKVLPISCNGSYMADDRREILKKVAEVGEMTGLGAGTSVYMGDLRPFGSPISTGGTSEGPTHFARLLQETVTVISQSNVRRGNCAVWLPIEHPDIERWLQMRSIMGGEHHPIQHLSFGITITDKWWEEMEAEEKGGPKRRLLAKVRNKRRETGFPYIMFYDAANDHRPAVLKDKGLFIKASNLCTEIMHPSSPLESFVCCLSSANLLFWDEWKDTPFIREMIYLLDAVIEEYIRKTEDNELMVAARRFAKRWRALGLGTLGYHSLLQSKMIAFESPEARALNIEVHTHVWNESHAASKYLAEVLGEPEGMEGTGYRNLTLNAIAPTTSSSVICWQVSQSVEPWEANIFENDTAKGLFTQKNRHLEALLESKGRNTKEVWNEILMAGGSVKNLTFLSDHEKKVFATFPEIDTKEILQQAHDRQYCGVGLDQGQSINYVMGPDATMADDIEVFRLAYKLRLKSLYYRKGLNAAQLMARENAACVACEA